MKRHVLAGLDLGRDELVISLDPQGNVDLRLWTDTAGVRFPRKHGIALPHERLGNLIAALIAFTRRDVA